MNKIHEGLADTLKNLRKIADLSISDAVEKLGDLEDPVHKKYFTGALARIRNGKLSAEDFLKEIKTVL